MGEAVDATSVSLSNRLTRENDGSVPTNTEGNLLIRNPLVSATTLLCSPMPIPWWILLGLTLIWIGQINSGGKLVFDYEIKEYAFPAGGGGRYRHGWLVLQDGKFKDFFVDKYEAKNYYESLVRDQEEKE